jgi:hypothetical protein
MTLAKLTLLPYTLYPSDPNVQLALVDNKRYTMRDIGKLEKRISNVEYYTSLSLLEQDTKSLTILDSNGMDRFKNGFFVDSFINQSNGNVLSADYKCSIDDINNDTFKHMSMDTLYQMLELID